MKIEGTLKHGKQRACVGLVKSELFQVQNPTDMVQTVNSGQVARVVW